jgi:predicted Zn-dependent protease
MAQSRIEIFAEMVKQQPGDAMIWYGLASEYSKAERWSEASDALESVVRINPDYTAAYQMLGTALMNQGRKEEARRAWEQGVEVARRTGAWKAQQHMEGLLAGMSEAASSPEFCD